MVVVAFVIGRQLTKRKFFFFEIRGRLLLAAFELAQPT